ncbi:MAG TPA: DUF3859 domain-containing protein [Tabrizicola sp.]|nr:DUF3859 domain-containing protein [Tabrizicola sp.]
MKSPVDACGSTGFDPLHLCEVLKVLPILRPLLCAAILATPASAELAPISSAPGIVVESYGIYCKLDSEGREEAPLTDLGYVDLLPGMPDFAFRQRQVPARLGISFGIIILSDRDIPEARVETTRPGPADPDIWYDSIFAGEPDFTGFSFDFEHELMPGIWRMEAFDGPTRLYSVEFEVLPGGELPGISSDCNLLS